MKFICALFSILMLHSCNSNTKNAHQSLLDNLVGAWQMDLEGGILREEWKAKGDLLLGTTAMLDQYGDRKENEKMRISMEDDQLIYEAIVNGHNEGKGVKFALTKYDADNHSYQFENHQHDFPTKIFYQFKSNLELYAVVSGNIEGKEQKIEFNYKKSK